MTPKQYARLVELQPRLRRAIIHRYGTRLVDDLLQDANVGIIERANADPSYLLQRPAYITTGAVWIAGDSMRRELAYLRLVDPDVDPELAIDGQAEDVELAEIAAIHIALDDLGGTTRSVALGLGAGVSKTEIAANLGIRKQSLAWHCHKIRRALS